MALNLTPILAACLDGSDGVKQKQAEAHLKKLETDNYTAYVGNLVTELSNEQKPLDSRHMAGVLLKVALTARSKHETNIKSQRWMSIPDPQRVRIRNIALTCLKSPHKPIGSTGSLLVGCIAYIECPKGFWNTVVEDIAKLCQQPDPHLRRSAYEALGYAVEGLGDKLVKKAEVILRVIIPALDAKASTDIPIRLAAIKCLENALDCCKELMKNPAARSKIMEMIFAACASPNTEIKSTGYRCVNDIAAQYYPYIKSYVNQFYQLTVAGIKAGPEEYGPQAIELWQTICDEEIDITKEHEMAQAAGDQPTKPLLGIAKGMGSKILPILLKCTTMQSEDLYESWSLSQSAATCLAVYAQLVGDPVAQNVMPYVKNNIGSTNWRMRESALTCFGCILDGPSPEYMAEMATNSMRPIVNMLKDTNPFVKDTAVWVIARICALHTGIITPPMLKALMSHFIELLSNDIPKVGEQVCYAINNLADAVSGMADNRTSPLSPYFMSLCKTLFTAAERQDEQGTLRTSCHEAINALVNTAAQDSLPNVAKLLQPIATKLNQSLNAPASSPSAIEKMSQIQVVLCGSIQIIMRRLPASAINQQTADHIMELLLRVLSAPSQTVLEEAIMGIGAVAEKLGKRFNRYMVKFAPMMIKGLEAVTAPQVCLQTTSVVGDTVRALEGDWIRYGDDIMKTLIANLKNKDVDRQIQIATVEVLADVALSIGGQFTRYVEPVMTLMKLAAGVEFQHPDDEDIEFQIELRVAVLTTSGAVLMALGNDNLAAKFMPYMGFILEFIDRLNVQQDLDDSLLKETASLIGDCLKYFQGQKAAMISRPGIKSIIQRAMNSQDPKAVQAGNYARQQA